MNQAKTFEHNIATQLMNLEQVWVQRLYDTRGLFGVRQPCDYIGYKYPHLLLLECKTTSGSSLPFRNISEGQFEDMGNATKKSEGLLAFIVCWFYEKDVTKIYDILKLLELKHNGNKSVKYTMSGEGIFELPGIKRHKYFDYDWDKFFEWVNSTYKG